MRALLNAHRFARRTSNSSLAVALAQLSSHLLHPKPAKLLGLSLRSKTSDFSSTQPAAPPSFPVPTRPPANSIPHSPSARCPAFGHPHNTLPPRPMSAVDNLPFPHGRIVDELRQKVSNKGVFASLPPPPLSQLRVPLKCRLDRKEGACDAQSAAPDLRSLLLRPLSNAAALRNLISGYAIEQWLDPCHNSFPRSVQHADFVAKSFCENAKRQGALEVSVCESRSGDLQSLRKGIISDTLSNLSLHCSCFSLRLLQRSFQDLTTFIRSKKGSYGPRSSWTYYGMVTNRYVPLDIVTRRMKTYTFLNKVPSRLHGDGCGKLPYLSVEALRVTSTAKPAFRMYTQVSVAITLPIWD